MQNNMEEGEETGFGPYLASGAIDLITGACALLVCNWRRAFFSLLRHASINQGMILHPKGRFGERRRCFLAQTFPGAILQFQKPLAPQTRKYLV
jgi:hypothetical protein